MPGRGRPSRPGLSAGLRRFPRFPASGRQDLEQIGIQLAVHPSVHILRHQDIVLGGAALLFSENWRLFRHCSCGGMTLTEQAVRPDGIVPEFPNPGDRLSFKKVECALCGGTRCEHIPIQPGGLLRPPHRRWSSVPMKQTSRRQRGRGCELKRSSTARSVGNSYGFPQTGDEGDHSSLRPGSELFRRACFRLLCYGNGYAMCPDEAFSSGFSYEFQC